MFPGQCGNTAFFFKSQPDQFHFEFRGIVFPGKSFFSAHEVSTCKISGCLSYRILDSGPDGTQTTLTFVEVNWVHNTQDFGSQLNGVLVKQDGAASIGEMKVGVEGQLSKRFGLWGNVAQQVGDKGYSDTSAMLGGKYSF